MRSHSFSFLYQMNQTRTQIRRLIRQADIVEINNFQYQIEDYNLVTNTGPAINLKGEGLLPRAFTMEELRRAERLDAFTLRMPESKHHLVFIKFQRLKIDGSKT
jgi:hypothetical protein